MSSFLLSYVFKIVILAMGYFMIFVQDKLTWTLYRTYHEIWEKLGSPGGFFWKPEGRRFRENMMMTGRFWFDNQFGLATDMALPEEVSSLYKLYIKIFSSMLIIFVLFILSLFGLHLHEAGVSPSDVTPSK